VCGVDHILTLWFHRPRQVVDATSAEVLSTKAQCDLGWSTCGQYANETNGRWQPRFQV
jgi:hypothetical protein